MHAFNFRGCIGAFQGNLNPYMTNCVLPVLLYGSENWVLNDAVLDQLESFQAWVGKRILGVPKTFANDLVPIALDLPSIRLQILARKLRLLTRLISGNRSDSDNLSLGSVAFNHLAMDNVYNITLVRQCLSLNRNPEFQEMG